MSRLSENFKSGRYREVLFWLLLLGSWQFLASPGNKNGIVGALGAAAFLAYAWANLGRLRGLGLDHARWRSATRTNWVLAGLCGTLAGIAIFLIGTAAGQNMKLGDDWKLITLQVTLGPVLEEVVFRGYLFAFLIWMFTRVDKAGRNRLAVVFAAVVFAAVHLAQPGVSWLQVACITMTGTLYGWIRCRSGSTGPAAVLHATYNLALYAISGVVLLGEKALSSPRIVRCQFTLTTYILTLWIIFETMEVAFDSGI
jgi:membrane protease YdiL (CAAX protease family)